jgi:fatty acid desaturase
LCLGGSFAPSHKGMPIVASTATIDFLRRQVLMSRNVRGGLAVDAAMGGLNYQIEHHLFPTMPRVNFGRVQPMVQQFCRERELPFESLSVLGAYQQALGELDRCGKATRSA